MKITDEMVERAASAAKDVRRLNIDKPVSRLWSEIVRAALEVALNPPKTNPRDEEHE